MRNHIVATLLLLLSSCVFAAVHPEQVVQPIHGRRSFMSMRTGTAWCLTDSCDVMVTNYHVVKYLGDKLQVHGVPVQAAVSATGPDDEGAKPLGVMGEAFKLRWVRDLALLRMKHALANKGMHGVKPFTGELVEGESVTVIGYPEGQLVSVRGRFDGVVGDGLLQFHADVAINPGASGAVVLNDHDEAVGVLFATAAEDRTAFYAVPMWSLADFIKKTDAHLYTRVFPAAPVHPELRRISNEEVVVANPSYTFEATAGGATPEATLPAQFLNAELSDAAPQKAPQSISLTVRQSEPAEVQMLRRKAQELTRQMKNFIAIQTLTLADRAVWQHQVRVVDGQQTFRAPDGSEFTQPPAPRVGPVPGAEWQSLAEMVGSNLRLPVRYMGEKNVSGRRVRIFQYDATEEDSVCWLRVKRGVFRRMWLGAAPCRGEVWTDAEFNIERITQEQFLPADSGLDRFQTVVIYGWLHPSPSIARLVPVSIQVKQKTTDGHVLEASGHFTNYRMFHATAVIR